MDEILHHYNEDHNVTSASIIVPYVLNYIEPKSIIDIGCGLGQWVSVFKRHGANNVLGVDGSHVPKEMRKIDEFYEFDLRNIKELKNKLQIEKYYHDNFDLCISLEVAEHLPEYLADDFISALTDFSNYILFSAAINNQTGENHINEQPHGYWIDKFQQKDYICYDLFRKIFWNNTSVNWWYRQNMYLFVKSGFYLKNDAEVWDGNMYIHPEMLKMYTPSSVNPKENNGKIKLTDKLKSLFR